MARLWKPPIEKSWWSFVVDGKVVATLEDNNKTKKEMKRLRFYRGIEIRPATSAELLAVGAATFIPKGILAKMIVAARGSQCY